MVLDVPVRGANGQRNSKRLLHALAGDPGRNNELFDQIFRQFADEYIDDEEYGIEPERSSTNDSGVSIQVDTDDELDASSSDEDAEIELTDLQEQELAVDLIQFARDAMEDGFYDRYLLQRSEGDDPRRRQDNALHLLGYINNGDHELGDVTHGEIVGLNRDVSTGVEGETRPLT